MTGSTITPAGNGCCGRDSSSSNAAAAAAEAAEAKAVAVAASKPGGASSSAGPPGSGAEKKGEGGRVRRSLTWGGRARSEGARKGRREEEEWLHSIYMVLYKGLKKEGRSEREREQARAWWEVLWPSDFVLSLFIIYLSNNICSPLFQHKKWLRARPPPPTNPAE